MKKALLIILAIFFGFTAIFAQSGDLPIPKDYEKNLITQGAVEKFLPVETDTLKPGKDDLSRGWLVYHRDRNFEVLPNSKSVPDEALGVLKITATPGEIESQSFSVYALRNGRPGCRA